MSATSSLVSVITAVYNGEEYLVECIESVLNQTHRHFEYLIVDNCSADKTLEIAQEYEKRDKRIRVMKNRLHVGAIENHNIALRYISPQSKYCKVVSADDRIAPECLERMVELAETYPTAGIVGCYQECGADVLWKGLPVDQPVFSGKDVCRMALLNGLDVFGTPTSLMFRSDLVRGNQPFFPHNRPHADTSACYRYLGKYDFGFVHGVLCEHRVHSGQASTKVIALGAGNVACIEHLLIYGPVFLDTAELESRKRLLFEEYYRWLGGCVLKMKGVAFWKYHTSRLKDLGHPIVWRKLIMAMLAEIRAEIKQPHRAMSKLMRVIKGEM